MERKCEHNYIAYKYEVGDWNGSETVFDSEHVLIEVVCTKCWEIKDLNKK